MKTRKPIIEKDTRKFNFDISFKKTFETIIDVYTKTLNDLNKVSSGKTSKAEFGVCNCSYKMRYLTPDNISEYVSNLLKGIESGLFEHNSTDIEMFSVASVKKFIEDNDGDVFESSSVLSSSRNYVNPKEYTLQDLLLISENDIGEVAVYSRGEMTKRIQLMGDDLDKINKMHFAATIKNIVRSMGDIIDKSNCYICNTPALMELFKIHLQEFILFACTLNTITALQLYGYCNPTVDYTPVDQGGGSAQGVVTECCLCNTNDFMIRNFIPFNCNMRDVVLQDVTPNFRDIHDALHFIMRNYRSPICGLVNKYATKEANVRMDCGTISRMFSGFREYHPDDDVFKHNGERMLGGQKPMDVAGFNTSVTWLDNIAFGNNYIDGNYRRDGNGNATVHPIMNTLDMLYKIFNGVELKTNEDLANNVVRVACLMRGIIHDYNNERPIENYALVKDILTVLGEIFTRNMLKLYYNNTRVFAYTDDMPDSMDPGFICMEDYIEDMDSLVVMEVGTEGQSSDSQGKTGTVDNSSTTKTPTGKTSTAAPKVSFTDKSNNELKNNLKTKLSILIQRFVEWVRTTIMRFAKNFNKNHAKEIQWITNNMELNNKIQKAIQDKSFRPQVTNMRRFNINIDALKKINLSTNFEEYMDVSKELNVDDFVLTCICGGNKQLEERLKKTKDTQEQSDIFTNYVLYKQFEMPEGYTGYLAAAGNDPPSWNELYTDLINTPKMMNEACDKVAEDLNKAATMLKQKTAEVEAQKSASGSVDEANNDKKLSRMTELRTALDRITKLYETPSFNALTIKFFKINYNLYRDIVAGYKQQASNIENNTDSNPDTVNDNPAE